MPTINYLDKNGLSHFWDKINAKKQDKLTAGTNITISANNTISATQPTVGNATLTIQKNGTNVQTFTANATSNKTANITVPTKTSDLTNDSDFVEDANYVHTDNNYTTTEKNKLAGIAAGAEVNVQANWAQTTTTADDYIKNKPTIPTVNNGTLTIQKNGTNVATFTANQSGNSTANITVPTIDDVVEIDKTLAAVTDWTNTGIQGADLETGTYVVQVFTGGAYAGTWQERWSGIMSWYSGNTNSSNTEEILLHNAGHADNSQNLFLRTKRDGVTVSGTKYLTLQYAFSQANETTTTIKFYFRRII